MVNSIKRPAAKEPKSVNVFPAGVIWLVEICFVFLQIQNPLPYVRLGVARGEFNLDKSDWIFNAANEPVIDRLTARFWPYW